MFTHHLLHATDRQAPPLSHSLHRLTLTYVPALSPCLRRRTSERESNRPKRGFCQAGGPVWSVSSAVVCAPPSSTQAGILRKALCATRGLRGGPPNAVLSSVTHCLLFGRTSERARESSHSAGLRLSDPSHFALSPCACHLTKSHPPPTHNPDRRAQRSDRPRHCRRCHKRGQED